MSQRPTREQAARQLGVTLPSSDGQIKRAYRRLAREHHPDRGGDARRFQELQDAFDRLVDDDPRRPMVTPARPSRTAATQPVTPSRSELDALDTSREVPTGRTRLEADLLASALARRHRDPVHPVLATSRAPGALLNGAAGVLAADLTSTIRVGAVRNDRGEVVVALEVTARTRRGRRAIEGASLEGVWVRRRRTSSQELRSTLPATGDRDRLAGTATARLVRLLDAIGWPVDQWVLTPAERTR